MAIVGDEKLWEGRLAELNRLAFPRENELNTLRATQPDTAFWKHHDAFTQTIVAYLSVMEIYFKGFDVIHSGKESADVSDALWDWVQKKGHRSPHTIASMNAAAQCSTLEGFLRALIPEWVDRRVADHVRARYRRKSRSGKGKPEELSKDLDHARKQLDVWLKPSGGGAFADWVKLVSIVFHCRFDPLTESVLEDMISFRHEITHPTKLHTDDSIDSPGPNRMICWSIAVTTMEYIITLSIVRAKASK